ncbi:MAG TPA: hypothetical protein VKA30_08465, partial [Actinomycetota bacterium]|nr:hypothetical protein [Actinomycetota bacterium]
GDPDPLINEVTVNATGSTSGSAVSDTATCSTNVVHEASLLVEKSCAPSSVPIGGTVTYTITITNDGTDDLEGITVSDSVLGSLNDSFADTFGVRGSESHDFDHVVTAQDPDPLVNTVTVEADGADSGTHVSSTAQCSTDVSHAAAIDVEKSCMPSSVPIGGTVTYTITVSNNGDDVLEGITVFDSVLGPLSDSFADTLDPGASESHDFDHVVTADDADPLENVVDVAATGIDSGDAATATASCSSDVTHAPGVAAAKTCDASAGVGDTITYNISITNTGDEPLTEVTVSDSILGDLSGSYDDTLGVGASETETFSYVVKPTDPDPLENEVTVTGVGEDSAVTASAGVACSTAVPAPPPASGGGSPATPPIALTGLDTAKGLAAVLMLLLGGTLLVFLGRQRGTRPEDDPGSAA